MPHRPTTDPYLRELARIEHKLEALRWQVEAESRRTRQLLRHILRLLEDEDAVSFELTADAPTEQE